MTKKSVQIASIGLALTAVFAPMTAYAAGSAKTCKPVGPWGDQIDGGVLTTATGGLNLRKSPSIKSEKLATIPIGAYPLTIKFPDHYSPKGCTPTRQWVQTTYKGKTGYVDFKYIGVE